MAVASDETDFTQNTSKWFHLVNQGLFPINDETLMFFVAFEKITQVQLPQQCSLNNHSTIKQSVKKGAISEDVDVQFHWTLISQDIDEEDAIELLTELYDMWVTICGSSMASTWLDPGEKDGGFSRSTR